MEAIILLVQLIWKSDSINISMAMVKICEKETAGRVDLF